MGSFMQQFLTLLGSCTAFLWSGPLLFLLLGTHLYFTLRLGFIQRFLPRGIRLTFSRNDGTETGVSPFGALATALAATIGTGNIIGISTAIALGGPGAVFWCWLTGLLGIATCYGECFLSMRFRTRLADGQPAGGPMYVLLLGLGKKGLARLFAAAAILASFGMGSSVQSHSIYQAVTAFLPGNARLSSLLPHLVGMATALLAGAVMLGGARKIAGICTFLVPFMSLFYLGGCGYLLFLHRDWLLPALSLILKCAFTPSAALGGAAGAGLLAGLRVGISRGLFTNEAGLGSIPMAAASSQSDSPTRQSLISMTGPFWDTVVICAVTGLVLVSSMLAEPSVYQKIPMEAICFTAFSRLPLLGPQILALSLILFAFATILGWCCYGERSVTFLAGEHGKKPYQVAYLVFVYLGAVIPLKLVWDLSDLLNALMMLPNLLALWLLRRQILPPGRRGI